MEFSVNKPIFKQIVDWCLGRIMAGEWQQGQKLPSARELSVEMAVNLHTILKAYEILERNEIIYSRRGMGFFVADNAAGLADSYLRREFFDNELADTFGRLASMGIGPDELSQAYREYLERK